MIVDEKKIIERPRRYAQEHERERKLIKIMVILVSIALILTLLFVIFS